MVEEEGEELEEGILVEAEEEEAVVEEDTETEEDMIEEVIEMDLTEVEGMDTKKIEMGIKTGVMMTEATMTGATITEGMTTIEAVEAAEVGEEDRTTIDHRLQCEGMIITDQEEPGQDLLHVQITTMTGVIVLLQEPLKTLST